LNKLLPLLAFSVLLLVPAVAQQVFAAPGDIVVYDNDGQRLLRITPSGLVSTITSFSAHIIDTDIASNGDFLLVSNTAGELLRVTPSGTVTVISNVLGDAFFVDVDSNGDFIVTDRGG